MQWFIYSSMSYMTKNVDMYIIMGCPNFKKLCLSILMHFTGAKLLRNDLKGAGDTYGNFYLLCKVIHLFIHVNILRPLQLNLMFLGPDRPI